MKNIKAALNITKKQLIFSLLLNLFSIPLFAQNAYYIPKSLIIPAHNSARQLYVSAGFGGGYDLNASYSFSQHLAVFVQGIPNFGTKYQRSIFGDKYNIHKNDYTWRSGIEYFKPSNNKHFNLIEFLAGAGASKIDNYLYFNSDDNFSVTKASNRNIFLQVNLIKTTIKDETALGLRLAYTRFTNFEFYDIDPDFGTIYLKNKYLNLDGITADPVVNYIRKFGKLKLGLQAGFSVPLYKDKVNQSIEYTNNVQYNKTVSDERIGIGALLGRINIEYKLDFKKR